MQKFNSFNVNPRDSQGRVKSKSMILRFCSMVNVHGPIPEYKPELGPCWIWLGRPTSYGYGEIAFPGHKGKRIMAHRFSYGLMRGPLDPSLEIDHLCRVRNCVNPIHLELVTTRENVIRGFSPFGKNARVTSCPRGHLYNEENTYFRKDFKARGCKICRREARRKCDAKIKMEKR